MNNEEISFGQFLGARLKDRNVSIKKLSEVTGIAPIHIENMLRGNFEDMPSTPYFRGYLMRIGKVLDFNGEEWWEKLRKEGYVKNSGPTDAMPRNRFLKKTAPKLLWGVIAVIVLVIIYVAFQFPRIFGKPTLTVTFPSTNPYTTSTNTLTLAGTTKDADSLYLNGDQVNLAADGSWQKGVLLQSGINTFDISAKKLLGSETDVTEEIVYQPSATSTSPATTTPIVNPPTSPSGTTSTSSNIPIIRVGTTTSASGSF